MAIIAAIPVLVGLAMLQIGVLNNLPLLLGYSDLVMLAIIAWALQEPVRNGWFWALTGGLLMTLLSAMPLGVYVLSYICVTGMVILMRKIVWRFPFIAMLTASVMGTFVLSGLSYIALQVLGVSIPFGYSFRMIIVPSIILNLLFAIPVYSLIGELANWIYPREIEV